MRRQLADHGIFLLRVTVSLLMLTHGIPKLLEYKTLIHSFPDPLNVGTQVSAQLMIFAEVGCSVLLLLGLLGRFASLTLFIAMFERDHGPLEYQLAYGRAMQHLSMPYPDIAT